MASATQSNPQTKTPSTSSQQTQTTQGRPSQSRTKQGPGGCTPGCQGYSTSDCIALIATVKQILPIGGQEWTKVQDIYNEYARANNCMLCQANPLKTKFKNLSNQKKPTGKSICPPHIREAKDVDNEICIRIASNAVVDEGEDEYESNDIQCVSLVSPQRTFVFNIDNDTFYRNGVGADVSFSLSQMEEV
jgi:hypothetical protein